MPLPPRSFLEPRTLSRSCYDLSGSQSAQSQLLEAGPRRLALYQASVSLNSVSQHRGCLSVKAKWEREQGAALEKDPISRLMTERHTRMEGGIQARSWMCRGPKALGSWRDGA